MNDLDELETGVAFVVSQCEDMARGIAVGFHNSHAGTASRAARRLLERECERHIRQCVALVDSGIPKAFVDRLAQHAIGTMNAHLVALAVIGSTATRHGKQSHFLS
ncbi:hypothetical protein [Jiella marina]|uniref:hypothetical protein n=1 Tax=Jiella sp. LLJ827 TaxID=2917712 RepID=UPI002100AEF2|nr:hypothetical protein [Jiella sp. LLJ827]MCQ0986496.1 hypothetical protein [Jiella sp. LLJ827]